MRTMPARFGWARLIYTAVALALIVAGCTRGGGPSETSYGTLTGGIARGPTSSVSRSGVPSSPSPVVGAELKIRDFNGKVIATARTDSQGIYRVPLPAGNYRAERGAGFPGAARNLPAIVSISPGGQTRLDIWVDNGIRPPPGPAATR